MKRTLKAVILIFFITFASFAISDKTYAQTTGTHVVGTGPAFNLFQNPTNRSNVTVGGDDDEGGESISDYLSTAGANGTAVAITGAPQIYAIENGNKVLEAAGITAANYTSYEAVYPVKNADGSTGNLTLTTDQNGDTVSDEVFTAQNAPTPVDTAKAAAAQNNAFGCGITTIASNCIAEFFYNLILTPVGYLMGLTGLALDASIKYSIFNISSFITDNQGGVIIAWQTIRDLANLVFIGVLIYVAVEAVIGKGDWKKSIANIIIAALLINFSMVITEVVIDASNIVTLQFYNSITNGVSTTLTGTLSGSSPISSEIMNDAKITTIYQPSSTGGTVASTAPTTSPGASWETMLVGMIMGTVLMIITSFVFLSGAILFIIRLVVLLILLVLSPIAFIGSILPKLDGMVGKKWRDALTAQAIFAPAYMILMWLSIKILHQISVANLASSTSQVGATVIGSNLPSLALLINFMIVIGFMLASVIIAAMLGAEGAGLAQKWAGAATFGTAAWIGRNTTGRVANTVANSAAMKWAGSVPVLGSFAKGTKSALDGVASSNFDLRTPIKALGGKNNAGNPTGKGGVVKELENRAKSQQKFGEFVSEGDETGKRTERYSNRFQGTFSGTLGKLVYGRKGNKDIAEKVQGTWDKKNIDKLADKSDAILKNPEIENLKGKIKNAPPGSSEVKQLKKDLTNAREQSAKNLTDEKDKEEYLKVQKRIDKAKSKKKEDTETEKIKKIAKEDRESAKESEPKPEPPPKADEGK